MENDVRSRITRMTGSDNSAMPPRHEGALDTVIRHDQPPPLDGCSTYDVYKKTLRLWRMNNADIPTKTKTFLLVESLKDGSKFKKGLLEKLMYKHSVEEMMADGGLELIEKFLDKELDKKELHKTITRWNELEECKRRQGEDIRNPANK